MAEAIAAAGIERLIARLRDDGVKSGEEESARLVREAEAKAAQIVAAARRESDEILARARAEIAAMDSAAKGALHLAGRDAMLSLRNEVRKAFEQYLQRLVIQSTQDPEFLRSLILILAGEAVEKHIGDKDAHIFLSKAILEGERSPEMRQRSTQFLKTLASGLLRHGITIIPSDEVEGGARVRLVREQLEIDLSDGAITELLLRHLTPRFREIMSGGE
jgi:V/A-type H+/Na+-transporting ATPase subunit E